LGQEFVRLDVKGLKLFGSRFCTGWIVASGNAQPAERIIDEAVTELISLLLEDLAG
jgi:hypothetical protein